MRTGQIVSPLALTVVLMPTLSLTVLCSCRTTPRPDLALLDDLEIEADYRVVQVHGDELTIFPFKGKPQLRKLNKTVYIYGAAFHPTKPWLVGPVDSGLVGMDFDGAILWTYKHHGRLSDLELCADGKHLAFEIEEAGRFAGTGYLEVASKTMGRATFQGRGPSWSPNCEELLLSDDRQIFRYGIRSREAKLLVSGSTAAWSPDGQSIVYRAPDGAFWLVPPTGVQPRRLFDGNGAVGRPHWSPDSRYLLFVRKAGRTTDRGLQCPEGKDVVAYRLRDGRSAPVFQVCKSAPTDFRWIKKTAFP